MTTWTLSRSLIYDDAFRKKAAPELAEEGLRTRSCRKAIRTKPEYRQAEGLCDTRTCRG